MIYICVLSTTMIQIEIILEKSEKFESLMSSSQAAQESANGKVVGDEKAAVANGKVESKQ